MTLFSFPCLSPAIRFAAILLAAILTAGSLTAIQAQAVFSSSQTASADTPARAFFPPTASRARGTQAPPSDDTSPVNRPFHAVAFEAKVGSNGPGFDVATPLNRFLHLRGGAQFYDQTIGIAADGIEASGDITLQNVHASVDIFPFRRSSFHLSPGVTLHNENHIAGPINIPGGQSFSLGDADYTSDPTDPIRGFSRFRFGSNIAPRITAGFGNMLPPNGSRFSFPFEIGIQYTSAPVVEIALQGSACNAEGCGPIASSDGANNLQSEIQMLTADIKPLRFFPIASIGVSYKFGR